MFELTQTAELSHWRGETDDKAWRAFIQDVRRKVGRSDEAPAKAAADRPLGPSAATAAGGPSVVAVLPLTYRASDVVLENLAEDLTEDITRELSQNSYFNVIAAGRMAAWRGRAADYSALGRELDARYLVEGKLQSVGEGVRLTLQLIDVTTGSMLWTTRFSRKLADIAAAPEEFPMAVSVELGERIEKTETNRALMKAGPFSGWDHVLRARAYWGGSGLSMDSNRMATEEARRAFAVDPDLGLAYAMLATALSGPAAGAGQALDEASRREIQTCVRRAMQLDGDNPAVMEYVLTSYIAIGESEAAVRLARNLVQIRPGLPPSHFWLATAYFAVGRTADAIDAYTHYERLTRFDPQRPIALTYLAVSHFLEGHPTDADAALDRALGVHPDFFLTLKWKAIVSAFRGEERSAVSTLRRLREVEPTMTIDMHVRQIELNQYLAERSAEAIAILRRLWEATEGDMRTAAQ